MLNRAELIIAAAAGLAALGTAFIIGQELAPSDAVRPTLTTITTPSTRASSTTVAAGPCHLDVPTCTELDVTLRRLIGSCGHGFVVSIVVGTEAQHVSGRCS